MHRALRTPFSIAVMLLVALSLAQPVVADTEQGSSGTVGAHSLNDTSTGNPGATCRYKYFSDLESWKINRISVRAPNMRAVAGNSAQEVGWSFIVQRRMFGIVGHGPWELRYTSPLYSTRTSDGHDAAFTTKSVPVRVAYGVGAGYESRVIVKMSWYRSNGHVQGTSTHRVDFYREQLGSTSQTSRGECNWLY